MASPVGALLGKDGLEINVYMAWHGKSLRVGARHGLARLGTAWHGLARLGTARFYGCCDGLFPGSTPGGCIVSRQVTARLGQAWHCGARHVGAWHGDFLITRMEGLWMISSAKTRSEMGTRDMVVRTVSLKGVTPIMFDRYPGDNDTQLQPHQKLCYADDGKTLVLPATNVMSFLSAKNTDSAPKRLLDSRKYKKFTEACASYVMIQADTNGFSENLVFTRKGKPLVFGGFDKTETCKKTGVYVQRDVARLEKGIPNPKVRPVLPLDWSLTFRLSLFPNEFIQEQQLKNVFERGGIAVGLGTWRGRFGKFEVSGWE